MNYLKNVMLVLSMLLASVSGSAQSFSSNDILGQWLNEEKDAIVGVYMEKGKFYGKIVWLEEPVDPETGKPKVDDENPDENLQNRPVMGLVILEDFEFEDGSWEGGTIYDPKNGKTYKCRMRMESDSLLYIRGYIGKAWMGLGRTTEWTRVVR